MLSNNFEISSKNHNQKMANIPKVDNIPEDAMIFSSKHLVGFVY